MVCQNCGKQLSEDAKFCDGCNRPVSPQPKVQAEPVKKKKGVGLAGILLTLVIVALAWGVGSCVGGYLGDSMTDPTEPTKKFNIRNTAYDDVFKKHGIIRMDALFVGDSTGFVKETVEEGIRYLRCLEVGYKDDVIHTVEETYYYDVSQLSESQKAIIDSNARSIYAEAEALDNITVSYNMGAALYTVNIRYEDIDELDTLQAVSAIGLLAEDTSAGLLSLSKTRTDLKNQGYIER